MFVSQLAVKALGSVLPNAGPPPGSLRVITADSAEFFRVKSDFLDRIANTYPKLKFEVTEIKEVKINACVLLLDCLCVCCSGDSRRQFGGV